MAGTGMTHPSLQVCRITVHTICGTHGVGRTKWYRAIWSAKLAKTERQVDFLRGERVFLRSSATPERLEATWLRYLIEWQRFGNLAMVDNATTGCRMRDTPHL